MIKNNLKVNRKSLGNPKLFYLEQRNLTCNHSGCLKGLYSAIKCANVGGNYDNDANADVFNCNVNNSTSNTNDNIGAHHQGNLNYALYNPCLLAEIYTQLRECTYLSVTSLEGD